MDPAPLDVVHTIGTLVQRKPADQHLMQEIVDSLEHHTGFEYLAALVIEPMNDRLVPVALGGAARGADFLEHDRQYVSLHAPTRGQGVTGWVAATGHGIRIGDVRRDPRYLDLRGNIRSELCVPICLGGRVLGVLNTETARQNAYSPIDQSMLQIVAGQLAVVIDIDRHREQSWSRSVAERLVAEVGPMLMVCSHCAAVKVAKDAWQRVDTFLSAFLELPLSHGLCPRCLREQVRPELDEITGQSPNDET